MNSPIPILLGLFLILGLAYGPLKENRGNPPRTENVGSSAIGESYFFDTESSEGYSPGNREISESIKNIEREAGRLSEKIEESIAEGKRSPYYGKITLSYLSGAMSLDPNQQYFYIYTNLSSGESVNITGWFFKSSVTGNYAIIGRAALLPFPFTHTESDVVLQPQERAIITKGFSPIGISFRTNKCTGFFEENRTFYPSLPIECPAPKNEKLPKFSTVYDRQDECLDIIERIPRCTTVKSSFIRDLPDTVTRSCKTYMQERINYNTCVANHYSDTDFPGREYRIFLNSFAPLWRERREKITLYDRNGLIVDSIEYDY